jgi:hypothetical protein
MVRRMVGVPFRHNLNIGSAFRIALAVGVGVLGVVMAHYPIVLSKFRLIQTALGDTRLIHYLLEHGYRWVQRMPEHLDFWSPPFFYPVKNAAAYSDVLLSVGPVYWLWRALGASPDLSFGLWMLSMSALNYAAGLLLFRRGFGFGLPAAVAGASLVAFGAPRLNQMSHAQLLPFFYSLLTLHALARLFANSSPGRMARAGYWLLATAGLVAQLYTAVYPGWFLIIGLGLAGIIALAMRSCRGALLAVVWRDAWSIAAAGAVGAILLQPFLAHYLPAAREVRSQYLPMLRALHPRVGSWLHVGAGNWFWGWAANPAWTREVGFLEVEHRIGVGYLTSIACIVGLYLGRKWPTCRVAAVTAFILWLTTTYLPGDRLATMATVVACYCVAGLFHDVDRPGWRAIGLAVILCTLLLSRFPNPHVLVLTLITIILCVLEIGRTRGLTVGLIGTGIALGVISLKLFDPVTILYALMLAAPAAALVAYYRWPRHWEVGCSYVALVTLFLILTTYLDRPGLLIAAFAAAPIALAASAPERYRPPAWLLVRAMLIALPFLALLYNRDSLWLTYSEMIPGAVAIRAFGRVVLILLVPAALGLACLVEFLEKKRSALASWTVALVCLAEQGTTTESFDAAANRATIEALATRIDLGQVAFYYHPLDGRSFDVIHLDAMWASLSTGVPTVNGYSGHSPHSWNLFFNADADPEADVAAALADWEQSQGLLPNHVQWIGANRPE